MPPARWTQDGQRGSDFHELVVLPTLAPELARDGPVGAGSGQHAPLSQAASPAGPGSATSVPAQAPAVPLDATLRRQYFVYVTAGKTVSGPNIGKAKRLPRKEESKLTTKEYPVLAMSRGDFITAALSVHQLEQSYKPGEHNGPPMRIHWTGSPGGKSNPPLIHTNDEWNAVLRQLRAKANVNTVNVVFDLDEMAPWGRKRPLSQMDDDEPVELAFGTSVPRVDAYTPLQRAVGQAAQEIAQHWKCNKHSTPCFVGADGEHLPITPIRLKSWSRTTAAGTCLASEPPPDELLQEWTGKPLSAPKARGRSGPLSLSAPSVTPAAAAPVAPVPGLQSDSGAAIMAAIMPLLTMVVQHGLSGGSSLTPALVVPTSAATHIPESAPTVVPAPIGSNHAIAPASDPVVAPAPAVPNSDPVIAPALAVPNSDPVVAPAPAASSSIDNDEADAVGPHRGSSPPPTVHEELTRCLESFGRERGVSPNVIDTIIGALAALSYTPDSIAVVPVERLQQLLPELEEGQVYALKGYATTWYDHLVTKRTKRARYSL